MKSTIRDRLAWLSFPVVMGGFVAQILFPLRAQLAVPETRAETRGA